MVYYDGFWATQRAIREEAISNALWYHNGTRCPKCGTEDNKDHAHQKRQAVTANSTAVDAVWECWSCGHKWPCYPGRA